MTTQDFLKPRYIVIAEDTSGNFKMGEIIVLSKWPVKENIFEWKSDKIKHEYISEDQLNKFPHLFRRLGWHEERNINDMPEYVHFKEGHFEGIYKVVKHFYFDGWCQVMNGINVEYPYQTLMPATKIEYTNYLKNSK